MSGTEKHDDDKNLGPESPGASGKHPIGRRKSGMRLELLEPEEEDGLFEEGTTASRRPSTCSLSRFRSCPQLAAAQDQVSPGIEVINLQDDLDTDRMSSQILHRHLQVDDISRRSYSPSPPSSPGSRSAVSLKEGTHNRICGLSPVSTPQLSRQAKRDLLLGRTSSGDSAPQDHMSFSSTGVQISVRDESTLRLDDFSDRFSKTHSDLCEHDDIRLCDGDDDDRPHHHHSHHSVNDDSRDKCQRWLQSLKITRADRIKSRSHIQLPPI